MTGCDGSCEGNLSPREYFEKNAEVKNPSKEDILRFILSRYQRSISVGFLNRSHIAQLIRLARKGGWDGPEFKMIERTLGS